MSKFCQKCGTELKDDAKFCNACGASTEISGNTSATGTSTPVYVTKREILTAILLSLVTCGIYGIFWFITMTDDANQVSGEATPSGAMAFLYSLITCGIYSFFWSYKMGQKMYAAGKKHGKEIADNSVLYLVLSLFGLSIVNYCLIQNDLNKFAQ